MTDRHYTANMMKGGAMVPEMLTLLKEWRPGTDPGTFTQEIVASNILGKSTRARVRDILSRAFFRRFAAPGVPPAEYTKAIIEAGYPEAVVKRLLYFHTALADDLLYDFAVHYLYQLYHDGRLYLDTHDSLDFINHLITDGQIYPPWNENIRVKTARGLLAALRDFGLLEGGATKRFVSAFVPLPTFVFVAYFLHDQGVSGLGLLEHSHWRLFLITKQDVERLFLEAHQEEHLSYYAAGGTIRVEWRYGKLAEAVRALVEATDGAS